MVLPMSQGSKNRFRLFGLACLVMLLFGLLVIQYYKIQILEGDKWRDLAERQHFLVVHEPASRGTLYSNPKGERGHPDEPRALALDIQKFHLYADPQSLPLELHRDIVKHLSADPKQQERMIKQLKKRGSRSRKLLLWLDGEAKSNILGWWLPFAKKHQAFSNALYFVAAWQRSHPYGRLAGQVLQTVQSGRDEKTGKAAPTGGLELALDRFLSGKNGKRRWMRSPTHMLETGDVLELPEKGADVYLTIDIVLQAILEDEIQKACRHVHAKAGWAVMMDPFTGEILAFAQYPFFYPAHYNDPDQEEITRLKGVTEAHEPGSVMKPITLAIALIANDELKKRGEAPLFHPEEKIATRDGRFPGRRPLKEINYHSYLNMAMALQKSSNIYMARLIQRVCERLGKEWYREQLHHIFGFGLKTEVELPGESGGVLPLPGKKHSNGTLEWSQATPFSLAIGHNIQVTSLQLLRAYALLANGGFSVQPTLIKKIVKNNMVVPSMHKEPKQLLSPHIIEPVVKAMKYVTKKGGKATRADIPGYTECGKTGTAEKIVQGVYSKNDHLVTFIGFAPVEKPAFVLLVSIDEPEKRFIPGVGKTNMGSYAAAPVFKEIGRRALSYLGIPQDDPYGFPPGDPRHDPTKADWSREVEALQALYQQWN